MKFGSRLRKHEESGLSSAKTNMRNTMTDLLPERLPFYTIGHSSRSLQEFIDLLSGQRVGCVVDVRKIPMSRTNPQFNSDILSEALLHRQIAYRRLDALGGLRSKAHTIPFELNASGRTEAFTTMLTMRSPTHFTKD
ncbi:uncharacterized protein DUF488 [Rhizobium sp. WW_1]|nr:uncharacterized protein DUF488 [Rhizobium sp. WW_1]